MDNDFFMDFQIVILLEKDIVLYDTYDMDYIHTDHVEKLQVIQKDTKDIVINIQKKTRFSKTI